MEEKLVEHIKIKIAISLNELLVRSKNYSQAERYDLAKSYNKIALHAEIRKATVNDAFNAKSNPKTSTLISIVEAMGFILADFSEVFYSIKDIDIKNFKNKKSK